ncbi:unnamed protein product [marine sediment metagenome]|uniref:Uncharacterized protein n=1 Tax=marine sediment metagenome TaxID=412755 RepID=X1HEX4_9ZZZZ
MGVPTLQMFWLAEYEDGQVLPQFDPEDGHENLFSEIDQARLVRFTWHPFTDKLAQKVEVAELNPLLNPVSVKVNGAKLIAYRRCEISYGVSLFKHDVTEYVLGIEGRFEAHILPDGRVEMEVL